MIWATAQADVLVLPNFSDDRLDDQIEPTRDAGLMQPPRHTLNACKQGAAKNSPIYCPLLTTNVNSEFQMR